MGFFRKQRPWQPSKRFVEKVRTGYLNALEGYTRETSVLWATVVPSRQQDIHEALVQDSPDLAHLLGNPLETDLYYGVDNLCRSLLGGKPVTEFTADTGSEALILQIAQSVGAIAYWNPNGGSRFPHGAPPEQFTADQLLDCIAARLSIDLKFPSPFSGESGFRVRRGLVTYRALNSLYQAARIRANMRTLDNAVVEIGGGMGRVPYFARAMGIRNYTIIDLPLTLVGQACFLAAALGEDSFSFDANDRSVIRLLAPQHFLKADDCFQVALNADSMTEMSRKYAEQYMSALRERADVLISINHEANDFQVCDLATPAIRFVYPLRPGYAEEYYFFAQNFRE
jgi:hypothetical protein